MPWLIWTRTAPNNLQNPTPNNVQNDTPGTPLPDAEALDDEPRNTAAALTVIAPPTATMLVPAMVADLGEAAALRFIDFFTANIRAWSQSLTRLALALPVHPNTRAACAVAVRSFFRWLEARRRP
jgi:hypothetical protein